MTADDDLSQVLNAMVEHHPGVAPARWPADDLDKLIDDFSTVAYRSFRRGDLFGWLIAITFGMALRNARLARKIRGSYRA